LESKQGQSLDIVAFGVCIKPQNTSIMVWLPWKSKKKVLETTEKSRETQESSPKKSAATREPEAAAPKAGGASGWTSKNMAARMCKLSPLACTADLKLMHRGVGPQH